MHKMSKYLYINFSLSNSSGTKLTVTLSVSFPCLEQLKRGMVEVGGVQMAHDAWGGEGVQTERAVRPAGSEPRRRKHSKKRAGKPKAQAPSVKEAIEL